MKTLIVLIIAIIIIGGGLALFKYDDTPTPTTIVDVNTTGTSTSPTTPTPTGTTPTGTTSPTGTQTGQVREVTVTGTNFDFNPEQIQVRRGDRVRLTFTSESGFHDWVVDEIPDAKTNRLNSGQSQTIEFVADRVGTFEYYCSVGNHRQMGMVGSLVITE